MLCVSLRFADGEWRDAVRCEQEVLRKMLHQVADFSGVELLTYAIMGNHFHVLVRVRSRARDIDDAELLRRYRVLYPKPSKYRPEDVSFLEQILKADGDAAAKLRSQLKARMGDVSEFMRSLKQRFSLWYNKSHNRFGPLWSDRFKSVVVENDPVVMRTIAAYIDLNPVRAGMVADPKDYRFCGYSEALAGNACFQSGVKAILALTDTKLALADYRMVLFGKGALPKRDGSAERLSHEAVQAVMAATGKLSPNQHLYQRLRYFTEGAVIGSETFVDSLIETWSSKIRDRRPRKANRMVIDEKPFAVFRRNRTQSANRQSSTVA